MQVSTTLSLPVGFFFLLHFTEVYPFTDDYSEEDEQKFPTWLQEANRLEKLCKHHSQKNVIFLKHNQLSKTKMEEVQAAEARGSFSSPQSISVDAQYYLVNEKVDASKDALFVPSMTDLASGDIRNDEEGFFLAFFF
jgi:hypothetical protein